MTDLLRWPLSALFRRRVSACLRGALFRLRKGANFQPAMKPKTSMQKFLSTKTLLAFAFLLLSVFASQAQVFVSATAGTVGPTAYTTVKLAFDAINAGTHQGDITIDISANTAEGTTPANLNSSGAGSAVYTSVLLRPTADGVSITGNPATGFGVIQLNGADNVTIDGDNPNTAGTNRNLTISNTDTTTVIANSVVRIATSAAVLSADNDTIKNCILLGNVIGGNASTITSSSGSSNSSFGIYAGGNGGATATSAPIALTSVTSNTAPAGTTINGLLVNNNSINQCARAIVFNGVNATVSTGVTISNNAVGDQTVPTPATPPFTAPATTVYTKGIWIMGTSAITITGNAVNNVLSYVSTTMTGIELNGAIGPAATITNNTVSNVVQNAANTSPVKGIVVSSASGTYTIGGNIVSSIQTLSGATNTSGIEAGGTATSGTIEKNKVSLIRNLNPGTFGSSGIRVTAGNNITLMNNFVSDVNMNATSGSGFSVNNGVHGLRVEGGTGHKIYNNSVNLFGALFGTPGANILTSAFTIAGTGQTGIDVRDNIFANTLTGGSTSIAHVSICLPSSGTSAMNLTMNNNDYFSGTTVGQSGIAHIGTTFTAVPAGPPTYAGLYTAADFNPADTIATTNLRTYTNTLSVAATNDDSSKVLDPQYLSNANLHLAGTSPVANMGVPLMGVTTDIDGDMRSAMTPEIGADEIAGGAPLTANSAVSRKTHGGSGDFDITLPLTGPTVGVECRSGGGSNDYKVIITFSNDVVSGSASVTTGTGSVSGAPTFSTNTMTVNLTGVTDFQQIAVTLSGVTDSFMQVLPNTAVPMKVLIGDTTNNSAVSGSDVTQTKAQSGNAVVAGNFRNDVNASGGNIGASDISLVKSKSGNSLP